MKRNISTLFILFSVVAFSQITKKVTTEYTYYASESQSLDQAKEISLQRAKIQIIADEFGTIVSQTNFTTLSNSSDKSTIDFQLVGMSDLRGEWIETIGEPTYKIFYSDGLLCVNVKVKGTIRQISSDYAKLNTKLLRNSTDLKFESAEFHNKDDLFLYFASPVNGFLLVYLIDNKDNAFCLLPYARQPEGVFEVEANKEYIFFSKKNSTFQDKTIVDEYIMTCDDNIEYNRIAIIFSENRFIKSADFGTSENIPRTLPTKDLNIWISKTRCRDLKMQYYEIPFSIKP